MLHYGFAERATAHFSESFAETPGTTLARLRICRGQFAPVIARSHVYDSLPCTRLWQLARVHVYDNLLGYTSTTACPFTRL